MHASSGNPPTTISVAPATRSEATSSAQKVRVTAERPTFESKLERWVLDAKPTDKFQYMLWWLYTRLGLHRTGLEPPLLVSWFNVGKATERANRVSNDLRSAAMAIIAVIAKKGGVGKTAVTTWLSATLARAMLFPVAILDSDRGGGLAASRYGITPTNILSLDQLSRRVDNGDPIEFDDLARLTPSDPETGVIIFHAPSGRSIGYERMMRTLVTIKRRFGILFNDTTPGLRVSMSDASAQSSDVQLIVEYNVSHESIELGVNKTLDYEAYGLRKSYPKVQDGATEVLENGDGELENSFMAVESVMVVIIGMPVRKCNARTAHDVARRARIDPSQVAFIPYDKYMDSRQGTAPKKVSLPAASKRARLAYAELGARVSILAAKLNQQKAAEEAHASNVVTLREQVSPPAPPYRAPFHPPAPLGAER